MNALAKLLSVFIGDKRELLYAYTFSQIGKRKCFRCPIEFGCADSVNTLYKECFGNEIGGDVSTLRLYNALYRSIKFTEVRLPQVLKGDIIISPTSMGNGSMPNGHVGVVGENGVIISNNSATGLLDTHITIDTWIKKYGVGGGFPILFYRTLI